MKLNKSIFGVLGCLAMIVASCANNSDLDCGLNNYDGISIYFSKELPSTHDISPDENVYSEVFLSRVDDSDEQTIEISVTQEDGTMYTIPRRVTFAPGEKTVVIPISYNPDDIEYGKYEEVTMEIHDGVTPYGLSKYSFEIGATAWLPYGTALYREDLMTTFFGVGNDVYEVEIEKHLFEEGMYRLVNPYGEAYPYNEEGDYDPDAATYLTINATDPKHVYVEYSPTAMDWGYGQFTMWSFAGYYINRGVSMETLIAENPEYFGTLEDGIITMPANSMLISMADYNNGGLYTANASGLFAVALPGSSFADYSIDLTYAGIFTNTSDEPFATAYLTLGADVTDVKAVVVSTKEDADDVADKVAAGEMEATDVEAGRIEVPIADQTGELQIVAVVIVNGVAKAVGIAKFEYYGGAAAPWVSIGTGYYTDDFVLTGYYDEDPYSYPVEIEESTETPGLYRIVNAYAPLAELFGGTAGDGNKNIVIHAEDPEGVYFLAQPVGLDLGEGDIEIVSEGGYYVGAYGFDLVKAQLPEVFGTLKDGVITLPTEYMEDYDMYYQGFLYIGGQGPYYTGYNGAFKLVLPDAPEAVKARAKAKAQAAQFAQTLKAANRKATHKQAKNAKLKAKKIVKADKAVKANL